jgi:hypothetical protein
MRQAQDNVGQAHMLDPKCLDLTISQIQGSVSLTHMLDPKR